MVNIHVAGFNAHNQLSVASSATHPDDIRVLTKLAESRKGARVLFAGWSSTVLLLDDTIRIHGHINGTNNILLSLKLPHNDVYQSSIRSVFGDANGPLGLITWTGKLYSFPTTSSQLSLTQVPRGADAKGLSHVAIAGNGRTSAVFNSQFPAERTGSEPTNVVEVEFFDDFTKYYADISGEVQGEDTGHPPVKLRAMSGPATSLLAGATCFVLLTEGQVHTWGDGRYPKCLGRTPSPLSPAYTPRPVSALGGIEIAKIDGRGWMFGALSTQRDLYLWGRGKPGSKVDLSSVLGDGQEDVKLLDGEKFEHVHDFAVGNGHVVVSVSSGVYVIGENRNGQLGIGDKLEACVEEWVRLDEGGQTASVQVVAGDASTFLLDEQ